MSRMVVSEQQTRFAGKDRQGESSDVLGHRFARDNKDTAP